MRTLGFVEQIARAEQHQVGFRQHHAFRHIGLDDGGGGHLLGKVSRLVHEDFAARSGRAAANAERQVVFVEDIGQPLDFAGAGDGEHHALAFARQLLDLFRHGGDRAMEAHRGLRL